MAITAALVVPNACFTQVNFCKRTLVMIDLATYRVRIGSYNMGKGKSNRDSVWRKSFDFSPDSIPSSDFLSRDNYNGAISEVRVKGSERLFSPIILFFYILLHYISSHTHFTASCINIPSLILQIGGPAYKYSIY